MLRTRFLIMISLSWLLIGQSIFATDPAIPQPAAKIIEFFGQQAWSYTENETEINPHDLLLKIRDAFFQPTLNCSCAWCGIESFLERENCDDNGSSNGEQTANKDHGLNSINEEKIKEGLQKNFNEQASALLESFFKTSLYEKMKTGIKKFITTIFEPNILLSHEESKRLSSLDCYYPHLYGKETQWKWNYTYDNQNNITGIRGTFEKHVSNVCSLGEGETLDIVLKLEYVYCFKYIEKRPCVLDENLKVKSDPATPTFNYLFEPPSYLQGFVIVNRHSKIQLPFATQIGVNVYYHFIGVGEEKVSCIDKENQYSLAHQEIDKNVSWLNQANLFFEPVGIMVSENFFYSYGFHISDIIPFDGVATG